MTISFDLPPDIEKQLRMGGVDLALVAKEAFLVDRYRRDRITHHQLAKALGLSRLEAEALLKRHRVSSSVSAEEMRTQATALREGLREAQAE